MSVGTVVPHGGEHMTTAAPTGTQAIDRAAQLLVRVVESQHPLAVGELAATAGLPKSTTSRLLGALERQGLERLAPRTIVDRRGLEAELDAVRARGYGTTVDELEDGLAALAAPVFDAGDRAVAALSISGPTTRLTAAHIERLAPTLLEETR